ncbi:MAG: hypothetical protein JWN40_5140 [Phycisphaerales bacterium]|nr:hypothetical protein [Phycisphaerales bacterium]
MTRSAPTSGLSLAQLERLMQSRRGEMAKLTRKRDKLQKQLDAIDERIASVSGGGSIGGRPGSRARNKSSLQEVILQVLSKSNGPTSVGDILDKVSATGYRSTSANFRGIVNQTLIKDKRFASAGRGMYQLKK